MPEMPNHLVNINIKLIISNDGGIYCNKLPIVVTLDEIVTDVRCMQAS